MKFVKETTSKGLQIPTAANHEPLMSCLSFIVMISILIMDNERSVHTRWWCSSSV